MIEGFSSASARIRKGGTPRSRRAMPSSHPHADRLLTCQSSLGTAQHQPRLSAPAVRSASGPGWQRSPENPRSRPDYSSSGHPGKHVSEKNDRVSSSRRSAAGNRPGRPLPDASLSRLDPGKSLSEQGLVTSSGAGPGAEPPPRRSSERRALPLLPTLSPGLESENSGHPSRSVLSFARHSEPSTPRPRIAGALTDPRG